MKKKLFKALMESVCDLVEDGTDEQCLVALAGLMQRIKMRTRVIQDEDGIIHSQIAMFIAGDKVLGSQPSPFEVPMVPAITTGQVLN